MFEIEEIHTLNATLKLGVKGFLNSTKQDLMKKWDRLAANKLN
jgi:hypothetical protein